MFQPLVDPLPLAYFSPGIALARHAAMRRCAFPALAAAHLPESHMDIWVIRDDTHASKTNHNLLQARTVHFPPEGHGLLQARCRPGKPK